MVGKSLRKAAWLVARVDRGATRGLGAFRSAVDGFWGHALTLEEKSNLCVDLYAGSSWFRDDRGLFAWEKRWFAARLPETPVSILLGGVGAGREAKALVEMGHRVDAFDPVQDMVDLSVERIGEGGRAWLDDYEAWAGRVLEGEGETYDAVLLGWGSFTHLLRPESRLKTLEAAARACPEGPIMLSFWSWGRPGAPRLGRNRLHRLACKLGKFVGARRGGDLDRAPGEYVIMAGGGVGIVFSVEEIETLANAIQREVIWEGREEEYPHVTLVKGEDEGSGE